MSGHRAAVPATFLSLVTGMALAGFAPARAATAPPPSPSSTWINSRLVELSFADPLVDPPLAAAKVRVLLPAGYGTSTSRYPVLYLLHGAGDTAPSWTTNNDGQQSLEAFTADKDVIVVMPDAGKDSNAGWYSNWFNHGAFGPPRWEDFHIDQLVAFTDANFRTQATRAGRVVAGLSMGGFGAMADAARHPDLFAAALSFSGAVNTTGIPYLEPAAFMALHDHFGTPTDAVWGSWQEQEVRWRGHNPSDLASNLALVPLWFATGEGVPGGPAPDDNDPGGLATESAIFSMNAGFAAALTQAGVPYTFTPYPQGGHNWWHWQNDLHQAWPFIAAVFAHPAAYPASWSHRSMETAFTVWGWQATTHRDVVEFLELAGVSSGGITLRGSGAVSLLSAPLYRPGGAYALSVSGARAGASPATAVADAAGRLSFDVTLGPSHSLQQYTPQERAAEAGDPSYWETAAVTITPQRAVAAVPAGGGASGSTGGGPPAALPNTTAEGAGSAIAAGAGLVVIASLRRRRRLP